MRSQIHFPFTYHSMIFYLKTFLAKLVIRNNNMASFSLKLVSEKTH